MSGLIYAVKSLHLHMSSFSKWFRYFMAAGKIAKIVIAVKEDTKDETNPLVRTNAVMASILRHVPELPKNLIGIHCVRLPDRVYTGYCCEVHGIKKTHHR